MAVRGDLFGSVKLRKPKTNGFDLSHQVLTTGNMGDLIPVLAQEVVPGDMFRCRSEIFCRLMPMLRPIMQRVDIYTHYFFVPNRLLWNVSKQTDSWQAFITGGKDGKIGPESGCVPPFIKLDRYSVMDLSTRDDNYNWFGACSLWDYLGLPTFNSLPSTQNVFSDESVLAYPFLAYQLIYDEYYRDQNLTEPILDSENMIGGKLEGDLLANVMTLRKRSWKKDYFTSALPWSQRGDAVKFPLGTSAPVVSTGHFDTSGFTEISRFEPDEMPGNSAGGVLLRAKYYDYPNSPLDLGYTSQGDLDNFYTGRLIGDTYVGSDIRVTGNADLSNASAITVQLLREGLRLQEWLERNAVGGARYVEQIYAHFGVVVPDATMQRPIYLGGGKQTIRISEVLQSVDTEDSPLGEMAGHGISVGRTHGFNNRRFTEHGWIIGILSVVPKASYMDGINRKWSRFDKLDYYFPEFAHLGEQEIKIKELNFKPYYSSGSGDTGFSNDETFGYQSRYAEYKYNEDRVNGEFRTTLKDWHLGREFDPAVQFDLNNDFVEIQPSETERIFAVQDNGATSKLLFQIYHDMQAIRPMPKFATPYI